jgi:hypothetical protein
MQRDRDETSQAGVVAMDGLQAVEVDRTAVKAVMADLRNLFLDYAETTLMRGDTAE